MRCCRKRAQEAMPGRVSAMPLASSARIDALETQVGALSSQLELMTQQLGALEAKLNGGRRASAFAAAARRGAAAAVEAASWASRATCPGRSSRSRLRRRWCPQGHGLYHRAGPSSGAGCVRSAADGSAAHIERSARRLCSLVPLPSACVAVSGGRTAWRCFTSSRAGASESVAKPDVTVLTVDHGLREGSREEAAMVARMAESLGLPMRFSPGYVTRRREAEACRLQAREARYDLMAAYCHAHDIPALVTAHHLDDQAETFLMRLKRGSGLDGLAAIPEASVWSGITVLRPLLDVPKARLAATLIEAGLSWAEDPSNADPRFERARMRAGGDALAKLGLTPEALARSAQRLRRARAALDEAAERFPRRAWRHERSGLLPHCAATRSSPRQRKLRFGRSSAGGHCCRRPRQAATACQARGTACSHADNPNKTHTLGGCRLQPIGDRLGVFRETRGTRVPVAPTCSRATRALGQPLQSRASAKRAAARHRQRPRRISLARSSLLLALACRAAALCGRHAPWRAGREMRSCYRISALQHASERER